MNRVILQSMPAIETDFPYRRLASEEDFTHLELEQLASELERQAICIRHHFQRVEYFLTGPQN